jgi:hypothetical protein
MKNFNSKFLFLFFISNIILQYTKAQCTVNFLKNPSFELPTQSVLGNNYPVTPTDWVLTAGTGNIIKVNGSDYYGGPNNAAAGNQYLDIVSANGSLEQSFTLTCSSVLTFSGDFSSREVGRNWTARIDILDATNVVVATSSVRNFTTADADNALPGGPDAVWYKVSGTSVSLPAGTYKFQADLDDYGNFDNAFLCASPGCVLPVKLSYFGVTNNDCVPTLQWKSTYENNLTQFEIERSEDGNVFNKVGAVAAIGGLSGANYLYTDKIPTGGGSYYRLRMVDNDGTYKYSDIVKLDKVCASKGFSILSNPVKELLTINNVFSRNNKPTYFITATDGKVVSKGNLINGLNDINTANLTTGVYALTVITNTTRETKKFVKQ